MQKDFEKALQAVTKAKIEHSERFNSLSEKLKQKRQEREEAERKKQAAFDNGNHQLYLAASFDYDRANGQIEELDKELKQIQAAPMIDNRTAAELKAGILAAIKKTTEEYDAELMETIDRLCEKSAELNQIINRGNDALKDITLNMQRDQDAIKRNEIGIITYPQFLRNSAGCLYITNYLKQSPFYKERHGKYSNV